MKDQYKGKDQDKHHFLFMISANEAIISKGNNNYSIVLKGVDHKVLFMTARPGRTRAFISSKQFITNWVKNNTVFLENPPRVAIIDSAMEVNANGIANAIEIKLSNPHEPETNHWKFDLKFQTKCRDVGTYNHITLLIDWPAALVCPEPIRVQVPSLISGS